MDPLSPLAAAWDRESTRALTYLSLGFFWSQSTLNDSLKAFLIESGNQPEKKNSHLGHFRHDDVWANPGSVVLSADSGGPCIDLKKRTILSLKIHYTYAVYNKRRSLYKKKLFPRVALGI